MTKRDVLQHLSEAEIMGFFLEELADDEQAELDAHVERCEDCAEELERLYEANGSFPTEAWEARRPAVIKALRARMSQEALEPFLQRMAGKGSHLWQAFLSLGRPSAAPQPVAAHAATTEVEWLEEKSDGANFTFSAAISRETGALVIRVDSRTMEFEDWLVEVGDERWSRGGRLARMGQYLFAEIEITPEDRESIPTGVAFGIRLTPGRAETNH